MRTSQNGSPPDKSQRPLGKSRQLLIIDDLGLVGGIGVVVESVRVVQERAQFYRVRLAEKLAGVLRRCSQMAWNGPKSDPGGKSAG
jgi:hypothetical protein